MVKRAMALAMALLLCFIFVACKGNDISSSGGGPASVPPTSSQSIPASIPEPEPEPLNQAFLTGLPKDADYPEGKRITAVMLNNVPGARPQNGIGDAKILVEIKVEYDVTRFMALYEDYETMPRVGGLRSARDQFFQLLIPTWGFYVHEGPAESEHPVNILMRNYEYQEFDITRGYSGFYVNVDQSRSTSSYSWYDLSADGIKAAIEARGLDDYRSYSSPFFDFWSYNEEPRVPGDGATTTVEVPHAAPYYVSYFDYDAASGRYGMSMHNSNNGRKEQTIDNNTGEQLFFDNVVVIFAPFDRYDGAVPLPKVDYSVGGVGYYFTQGGWELFIWRKGPANAHLLLYQMDDSGNMVQINPGTTYLAVVDDKNLEAFDTALNNGTMGQGTGAVGGNDNLPAD